MVLKFISAAERLGLIAALVAIALPVVSAAQSETAGETEVKTRPGSAIIEIHDVIFPPVWCDSALIALQREQAGRRWIEYHDIERKRSRIEDLHEEGGLVACSRDGAERLMNRAADGFVLVRPGDRQEIGLSHDARFISADDRLRRFILGPEGDRARIRPQFRLVTFDPAVEPSVQSRRQHTLGGVPPQFWWPAAINGGGRYVAYVTGPEVPLDLDPAFSSLRLVVAEIDGPHKASSPLPALMGLAAQFERVFFDRGSLVLQGVSDQQKLVVVICTIQTDASPNCFGHLLVFDAAKFHVVGLGANGLILGSNVGEVGASGLRACLFALGVSQAPPRCQIDPDVRVPRIYGERPEAYYSISPNRDYVAVLSRYRQSRSDPAPLAPAWVVIPTSELQAD
jgi:hypothetical protein